MLLVKMRGYAVTDHYGATLAQLRADSIQAEARKEEARRRLFRAPPPLPEPPAKTEDTVSLRLSEEIDYVRRLLEDAGNKLIADPVVLHHHMQTMQSFDLMGQLLGHLAKVVASADREAAIERIGMHELKSRLKRKPLG